MRKIILIIIISVFYQNLLSQNKFSENYNLMPWPQKITPLKGQFFIDKEFKISINKKDNRVYSAATDFIRKITNRTGIFIDTGFPEINKQNATLQIEFKESIKFLTIDVDESYTLNFTDSIIKIIANTDIGVLRGLKTLLQLTQFNEEGFYFQKAEIKDFPRFKWRGLMIDAARHFQPVNVIKRNLEAMASVKMNVFHWHLSDDQGFRIESKIYPKLQELGSDGQYYTQNQIKEVVAYANNLGIRVIPEIDVPGHASAMLTAYPELGSKDNYDYKIERFAGVFNPTLNPTKPEVYVFLDNLFAEVTSLFPDTYFHIGGDENEGKHWDSNNKIQLFKKEHNLKTNHDLQTYFNIKLEKILKKYGKKTMGWDEIMTPNMPKTAVIHSWRGIHEGFKNGTLIEAIKKGYKTVLSNGYYIDRMLPVEKHYLVDPITVKLTPEEEVLVLGGETTMWSELVTPTTIDSRIWPRTAAIAERFWSSKSVVDVSNMKQRLQKINLQLEELGLTHIKNRHTILRNLTKAESIEPLKILTDIYEPLKVYSRNKGGTEYKSFSPFTLFADACTTDAADAFNFNKNVEVFFKSPSKESKQKIIVFLEKWSSGYKDFSKLNYNPLLKNIKTSYKDLSIVSENLRKAIKGEKLSNEDCKLTKKSFDKLKNPLEDTELMIHSSLEKLLNKYIF